MYRGTHSHSLTLVHTQRQWLMSCPCYCFSLSPSFLVATQWAKLTRNHAWPSTSQVLGIVGWTPNAFTRMVGCLHIPHGALSLEWWGQPALFPTPQPYQFKTQFMSFCRKEILSVPRHISSMATTFWLSPSYNPLFSAPTIQEHAYFLSAIHPALCFLWMIKIPLKSHMLLSINSFEFVRKEPRATDLPLVIMVPWSLS